VAEAINVAEALAHFRSRRRDPAKSTVNGRGGIRGVSAQGSRRCGSPPERVDHLVDGWRSTAAGAKAPLLRRPALTPSRYGQRETWSLVTRFPIPFVCRDFARNLAICRDQVSLEALIRACCGDAARRRRMRRRCDQFPRGCAPQREIHPTARFCDAHVGAHLRASIARDSVR
jgi:hypothetical protein